jgi:cellulose biosynthesis protein BcsQ
MKAVGFFTNKGGVGKTTLLCNVAGYLGKENSKRILIVDADPQSNATQYVFPDEMIGEIYDQRLHQTIYDFIKPVELGKGFADSLPIVRSENFGCDVVLGDPRLALMEDVLASDWSGDSTRGLRTTFLFRQLLSKCAHYDYVFFDMGPSLGSINRSVLLACDFFVIPISIDIFSVRAVENISAWLRNWQRKLSLKLASIEDQSELEIADIAVRLQMVGYVNQQYTAKRDSSGERRAVRAFEKIMKDIPATRPWTHNGAAGA